MGDIKWYKRDPDAALQGMMVLTLEERGAYNTVLDMIYSNQGKLIDDDRFIAGWMMVDLRVWKRIRTRLLELGKVYLVDGFLRNSRADKEVDAALDRVASAQQAGRASASKRAEVLQHNTVLRPLGRPLSTGELTGASEPKSETVSNKTNDVASTPVQRTLQLPTTTPTKKENNILTLSSGPGTEFDAFWKAYPRKVAKGRAQRAWRTAIKIANAATIIIAVEQFKWPEPQFIPHPATWLNDRRWEDAKPAPATTITPFGVGG
jgi:uncharacterized protein YdaU (DUF1376 family)